MKYIYKILGVLTLAVLSFSCEEEPLIIFNGEAVSHFPVVSGGLAAITDEDTYELEIGTTTSATATVQLVISDNSTAIEGVHFQEFTKTATIADGQFVTSISIVPLVDNLQPGQPVLLVINIAGGAEDVEGEDYEGLSKSFVLTLERNCPSTIQEGTYWETATGTGGAARAVTLTAMGDGRYELSQMNFDYYNPGYDDIPGEFVDVCDVLTLQGVATSVFGIAWVGTGTYDPVAITLSFTVSDATYNPDFIVNMVFEYQP